MKIGTRSLLFGVHQFLLHPLLLAYAWWRLFGFRRVQDAYVTTHLLDPRLWVCFFVHDLGYWGSPDMDGARGEAHPFLGARIATWCFDTGREWRWCKYESDAKVYTYGTQRRVAPDVVVDNHPVHTTAAWLGPWGRFCLAHSRFLAKRLGYETSALFLADKQVIVSEPAWLYLPRAWLTGEVHQYMQTGSRGEVTGLPWISGGARMLDWHSRMVAKVREVIAERLAERSWMRPAA